MSTVFNGVLGGATQGASTGFAIGGPWGAAAGGLLGGIGGLVEGNRAADLRKKYEQADKNIPLYDAGQVAYLNKVRQQERLMRAGADASSAFAMRGALNAGAQTQNNLLRATPGVGAVQSLLRSQALTQNQMGGIGANATQAANSLLGLEGTLINNAAQRVLDRQREIRNRYMAESAQARQDINNRFAQGISAFPSIYAQGGQRTPSPAGGPQPSFDWRTQGTGTPMMPQQPQLYSTGPNDYTQNPTSAYQDPEFTRPVI